MKRTIKRKEQLLNKLNMTNKKLFVMMKISRMARIDRRELTADRSYQMLLVSYKVT